MASKKKRQFVTTFLSAFVIAAVLTGSLIYLAQKIEAVDEDIDNLRSSLFNEVESHYSALQSLHSSTVLLSEDMREMRELLGLKASEYEIREDLFARQSKEGFDEPGSSSGKQSNPEEGSIEKANAEDETLFFEAIDRIEKEEERRRVRRSIAELFSNDGPLSQLLRRFSLRIEKRGDMNWELVAGDYVLPLSEYGKSEITHPSYAIRAAKKSPEVYSVSIYPPVGTSLGLELSTQSYRFSQVSRREIGEFIEERQHMLEKKNEQVRRMIERIEAEMSSESFRALKNENNLRVSPVAVEGERLWWSLRHQVSEDGFRFGVDAESAEYLLADNRHEGIATLRSGIRRMVDELDTRTKSERSVDRAIARIERISEDDAFGAYLDKRDLRLNTDPREGSDHIYFDILHPDGSRFGAFAVQKHSGEIYLVDSEEVVITSFSTLKNRTSFSDTGGSGEDLELPDNLSEWSKAGTEEHGGRIVLLCGVHEDNADTIMLAHLNERRIAILSLPRDLYYHKRKLTSYYQVYGPQQLMRIVSDITGLDIDGYVSIDMYAFIDVIDILGGIEVKLDEALIDPTYKVREDGVWKTLYYPAGTHDLGGVETLRIARSRHTSDDFDRTKRQQLIVEAIKKRLNELHAGDVKKLKNIFDTLFEYIETDYSMLTAVRLFAEYHDVPVSSLSGASSENILYATYSNLHRLDKRIEEVDEGFPKGAWILLPKEDNWQLIKWYVQEKFGMNGA